MALGWFGQLLVLSLVAFLGERAYQLYITMDLYAVLEYKQDNCRLVGEKTMSNSEDLAMGRFSVLFITVGDLDTCFHNGSETAEPGGIWVYNLRGGVSTEPQQVELTGYPAGARFQGHGLFISNATDTLYAINHRGQETTVEVFGIGYNSECLVKGLWKCPQPVKLTYKWSVKSSLFPRYALNDVVEGKEKGEIYVTRWLAFPKPARGTNNPENLYEKLLLLLEAPIMFLRARLTKVYRCTWGESGGSCEVASDTIFMGSNGMTVSEDRNTVYVNDVVDKKIAVMNRGNDGFLTLSHYINLPFMVDNIELDYETGEILMGTLPSMVLAVKRIHGDTSVVVPGGLAVARSSQGGGADDSTWEVEHLVLHDGQKLSQIAAGARFGQRVILGSPFSRGILVCN